MKADVRILRIGEESPVCDGLAIVPVRVEVSIGDNPKEVACFAYRRGDSLPELDFLRSCGLCASVQYGQNRGNVFSSSITLFQSASSGEWDCLFHWDKKRVPHTSDHRFLGWL